MRDGCFCPSRFCFDTKGVHMASSAPRGLRSDHVVTVGIALFSMLFGAGNLIIPPLLALQAGTATPLAMIGFLIAAIGLPVMGFIAVALAGTARELAGRVHPKFGEFFVACIWPSARAWPFRAQALRRSKCWCRCYPRAFRSARHVWCLPSGSSSSRLCSRCARVSSHACSAALRAPRSLRSSCWSWVLP